MQYTRDLGTPIPVIRVIVYYADGSKGVALTQDEWKKLPDTNVQVVQILYRYYTHRKYLQDVIAGENCYWYYNGHYYGGNAGQVPQGVDHVKLGSWVSDEQYLKLYNEALEGIMA